ncbi:Atu4866 domain-containing protein [Rhodococcus qingshengii]|uniref:Atu4866 domain-containing protein n=1 Tax=Rhodococcus qingshengii TaxID=334542 RepID=UPI0010A6198E|nr:Atu4866 domain-containing protein [Rhodococcus qingshengii]THJ65733.1 hypothetical protein EU244_29070 [Rhodococcus qingshengii]
MTRALTISARVAPALAAVSLILGGCSSGDPRDAPPSTTTRGPTSIATSGTSAISPDVPGTYSNGDWVLRLEPDGTWEEDLRGQANAYGGQYTVEGDKVILRDRGGSSETATLQGDELHLPSIVLRRS